MSLPSSSAQQLRQALGQRLREIRLQAKLTARELGRRMGRHPSKVSRIEHGNITPSAEDISAWCTHCGAQDQVLDLIASLRTVEGMFVEWQRIERTGLRHAQQSILPLYERTRLFRAYSSWLIPGVLQTFAYTTAVLRLIMQRRGLPDDLDQAMPYRTDRQRVLHQGEHQFAFLLEESVLRAGIGGEQVMIGQLGHLITASSLPRVNLGIIPMGPDRTAWPVEDFWIFDDIQVNVELVSGYLTLTHPRDINMYIQAFVELAEHAVYGAGARSLITAALDALGR